MPNTEPPSLVKSVAHALDILDVVARAGDSGVTLAELAPRVGMAKSSASASARTLAHYGFLHIEMPGPRFKLGFALLRYGDQVTRQTSLGQVALPILHELAESTGLTARLALNDDGYPVFVERVDGHGSVRFHATLGQRESPHATGAGKVILAYSPTPLVRRVIGEHGLPRYTDSTITEPDALMDELERVRLVGFGVDNEEESDGVVCVGAPVFDHLGTCLGALSLTGLKADLASDGVGPYGAAVMEAAQRITRTVQGGRR
ncbi:MAG: IclR family transcriptional regulator [Acidobacteria bacterium]|nr:IclR family transcriptional regulator [Acidobacteriota bacterium]